MIPPKSVFETIFERFSSFSDLSLRPHYVTHLTFISSVLHTIATKFVKTLFNVLPFKAARFIPAFKHLLCFCLQKTGEISTNLTPSLNRLIPISLMKKKYSLFSVQCDSI